MATTSINIRMDSDLKKQFEAFCADMGMSMTTAFNIFAKKTVREYRIPFEIGAEQPNAETKAAIEEVQALKKDPNKKTYKSFSELLADLDED
jgi:DNA-damage-inducible protein J